MKYILTALVAVFTLSACHTTDSDGHARGKTAKKGDSCCATKTDACCKKN